MTRELRSISIVGSRGRMGRALAHLIDGEFRSSAHLKAALHSQSPDEDWQDAATSDVWVDFSLPAGMNRIHSALLDSGRAALPALVIGTTGHQAPERAHLDALAARTLVLQASNFSIGILILRKALEWVSPQLADCGFKPVLTETHHIHKKDAPSGTALALAKSTSGLAPDRIHSIRAGEVVGDHEVVFHGHGEQVGLSHRALSREIFARGALEAALWLAEKRAQNPTLTGQITLDEFFEERFACLTPSR